MKAFRLYALALCLVLVFAASTGAPPASAQTVESYVPHKTMWAAKRANVRAGPSTDHVKLDLLEVGERVTVVAKIGDWFRLRRWPGEPKRYVFATLLTDVIPSASKPSAAQTVASTSAVKTISYSNGDRYQGQIHDGKRHGRGVYTWPNGDRYEGDFVKNKRTGRGVFTWPNGKRYEGEFVNGWRTGRGVFTWPNGDRYEGDFMDGKRTGRGVYTWPNGNRYEGDFMDGKRTGRGVFTWPSGERYEGEFVNGWRTGRGVVTWANGRRYEGEFVEGKLTGQGTYTEAGGQAWGAVAVETDTVAGPRYEVCQEREFYIAVNLESPAEAGSDARAQCNAYGANCDVKRYFDECAAFARGYIDRTDGGRYCVYGVGAGSSKNAASYYAKRVCSSDALQPLASGGGLSTIDNAAEVYGCEIRLAACNNMEELRKRQQVARRMDSRQQRQDYSQQDDRQVWVAIADGYRNRNYEGGVLGLAWGRSSKNDALKAALADCRNKGGYECGQRSGHDAFENKCIAVAEASLQEFDELYFHGTGDSRAEAQDGAELTCQIYGATGCYIIAAECG